MKKTQLALAALALVASTAVLADGVTVSGSLDAGLASTNSAANSNRGTAFADGNWNGGSYFTISGTEAAGNGLKVGFTLQTGMNMTNGTMANGGTIPATDGTSTTSQGVFNRQANISVSGDFGTVIVGQQLNQYIAGAAGTELANAAFGSFTVNSIVNGAAGGIAGGFFTPNAVTYALPSIAGLNVAVQTQIKGPAGADTATMSSASASYALGDINFSAGAITRGQTSSAITLGASMPIAGLTANVRYTEQNSKNASIESTKQIQGGVAYPFSEAITLSLQHANRSGLTDNSLTSIGAYYKLSNSAGLYAIVNRASNGQTLFYSGGSTSTTSGAGNSMTGLAIGAVKNF
ncbi:Porin domain, Gram-negative type [Oxalobacteraceae bacterium]